MAVTRSMKLHASRVIEKKLLWWFHLRDPISLDRIKVPFRLVRHGCVQIYDASSLYNYITSSGDFYDPISRKEYDICELLRLEHRLHLLPHSIMQRKDELLKARKDYFSLMGLCDVLEMDLMDHVNTIRSKMNHREFELLFRLECIPGIIFSFENFKMVHIHRCVLSLKHVIQHLKDNPISHREIHTQVVHIFQVLLSYCS